MWSTLPKGTPLPEIEHGTFSSEELCATNALRRRAHTKTEMVQADINTGIYMSRTKVVLKSFPNRNEFWEFLMLNR